MCTAARAAGLSLLVLAACRLPASGCKPPRCKLWLAWGYLMPLAFRAIATRMACHWISAAVAATEVITHLHRGRCAERLKAQRSRPNN